MAKKELKQFPKITFRLTPKQRATLAPFAEDVGRGAIALSGPDSRRAVFADLRVLNGEVQCFLIQAPEVRIINRAIMRARKQLK